jgi:hypothetical protein
VNHPTTRRYFIVDTDKVAKYHTEEECEMLRSGFRISQQSLSRNLLDPNMGTSGGAGGCGGR